LFQRKHKCQANPADFELAESPCLLVEVTLLLALTFQAARSGSLIFDQLPGIQAAKTPQTAYPNEKYGN